MLLELTQQTVQCVYRDIIRFLSPRMTLLGQLPSNHRLVTIRLIEFKNERLSNASDCHQSLAACHFKAFIVGKLDAEVLGPAIKVVDNDFIFGLDRHFVRAKHFDLHGALRRYYS